MLPHPCHATFQLIYKSLLQNKIHPPSREYLKKNLCICDKKKKSLSQRLPILYSAAFVIISLQTYKVFIHLFQADLHKAKVKDFHSLHCTCLM